MDNKEKDKVIGKALYVELRTPTNQTYQMLITPDGVSSSGRAVPSTMYRRQISKLKPRRAWKTYSLPALPLNSFGVYETQNRDDAAQAAETRMNYIATTITQLNSYSYKLYKTPIIVEVAQEDLESIRLSKTPYKILGRITRVRRSLGFGELIAE
jgi:hypothetical protein